MNALSEIYLKRISADLKQIRGILELFAASALAAAELAGESAPETAEGADKAPNDTGAHPGNCQ